MSKKQNIARFYQTFESLGFSFDETEILRRAQMTLHRWAERECNGEVERDETTGKTYAVYPRMSGPNKRVRCPDRESGALKRIEATIAARNLKMAAGDSPNYPRQTLTFYVQGDPRGCALYIIRATDVPEGKDVEAYYSRGVAVCI